MTNKNADGVETEQPISTAIKLESGETAAVRFTIHNQHLKLTAANFTDVTDRNNELVQTQEWLLHTSCKRLALAGNLFLIEDLQNGTGRTLIKEAPLPGSRPCMLSADLITVPGDRGGFDFYLIQPDHIKEPQWTILEYNGGTVERLNKLHAWQQSKRPDTPAHRHVRFISNTWGDRSRDSRINDDFIKAEIDAAAALGVDVVQIDDGWQQGITANSAQAKEKGGLWEGFWNGDSDFWEVNRERLPNGLEPILEHAAAAGVTIGLWFAPDSWNDCAHWEKDADTIIRFYKKYGIEHIKIDSIVAKTDRALANLHAFFAKVLEQCDGNVVFDFDITAGIRPGYFGLINVGPLFVENRYTDWHNYWPHQTLRNVWSLSQWIDPRRLRMEFLNNTRNTDLYSDDPLGPINYPADTLFATVMMTNPLGWFEASNLPDRFIKQAAPLIRVWREHRDTLFNGTIIPIGKRPDGFVYTGFLSIAEDQRSGYALILREFNPEDTGTLEVPAALDTCKWNILHGSGTISSVGRSITAKIQQKFGIIFAQFKRQ